MFPSHPGQLSMGSDSPEEPRNNNAAVESIEDLVLHFLSQLDTAVRPPDEESEQDSRQNSRITCTIADRTKPGKAHGTRNITYPRKNPKGSARPLAQLLRVLDIMHEALVEDVPATKRDVYYRDVQLFKTQKTVDNLVDDLAATFELERSDLNIRATSKGLVCGSGLSIELVNGEIIHASDTEPSLIPVGEDVRMFNVNGVSWVLIVEKDAVFQTLCRLGITSHPSLPGPGLIITGKGYPDIATRHLVKMLSDCLPSSIPLLGFVDCDPYGIDILSVYRYGSQALRHEQSKLAAARIKWLGLWSSELSEFGIEEDSLLPITKHDEKKAYAFLRRPEGIPNKWKKELTRMLYTRRKAEIEALSGVNFKSTTADSSRDEPSHSPLLRYLVSKISIFVALVALEPGPA
ncbi:DNA topoisomerase IV alpha subunit [Mycena floridula]|nr:DNA topoisomerase IV alpha subunit [Mycena floridula]